MKNKILLMAGITVIVLIAVLNVSIGISANKVSDLSLAGIVALGQYENDENTSDKDDEQNVTELVTCSNGNEIECVVCISGKIDCSPTCSIELCK